MLGPVERREPPLRFDDDAVLQDEVGRVALGLRGFHIRDIVGLVHPEHFRIVQPLGYLLLEITAKPEAYGLFSLSAVSWALRHLQVPLGKTGA